MKMGGDPRRRQPALLNKLKHQRQHRINQRRPKDAFGGVIPVGIDIKCKKRDIQHQTRHRHRRDLAPVGPEKIEEVPHRIQRKELHKIIDDEADDRGYQP